MRVSIQFSLVVLLLANSFIFARADTFGSGENTFEIEFVTIGDPGNPADESPNPAGAVDYEYRIGKYEIPEDAVRKVNTASAAAGEPLGITLDDRGPDKPATSVSWFEAAKFVNWLNTTKGVSPAYKFDDQGEFQLWEETDPGFDEDNLFRNARAFYFLPSIDEWHKAAYYDPINDRYFDYPTGSDDVPDGIDFPGDTEFDAVFFDGAGNPGPSNTNSAPNDITDVGLLSPFGTAGQGGNVAEWEETTFGRENNSPHASRAYRGGGWGNISTHLLATNRNAIGPAFESSFFGFRVISIPEPNTLVLTCITMTCLLHRRSRSSVKNAFSRL